jgi:hypothetical protein
VDNTPQQFFSEHQNFVSGQLEFAKGIEFGQFLYGFLGLSRSFYRGNYFQQDSAGAGIFSSTVGNSSGEATNVASIPSAFNPAATIFRTSSLSATTSHVAISIDAYWIRVNSQP